MQNILENIQNMATKYIAFTPLTNNCSQLNPIRYNQSVDVDETMKESYQ